MDLPVLPADALIALRSRPPETRVADEARAPCHRSEAFAEDLWSRAPQPAPLPPSAPVRLLVLAPLACALAGAVLTPLLGAG